MLVVCIQSYVGAGLFKDQICSYIYF